ncbi:hypothetical protein DFH28DRAFT_894269, partial [Melampsora americana]
YSKTYKFHKDLFGCIFSLTLIFIMIENITFLCSEQKAIKLQLLVDLNDATATAPPVTVNVLLISKDLDQSTKVMKKITQAISNLACNDKTLGCLTRDRHGGDLMISKATLLCVFSLMA